MLARLMRACRVSVAGIAWLLDYGAAVAYTAWDGVGVSRRRGRADAWSTEALFSIPGAAPRSTERRILPAAGSVAASLALIGVLSVSVAGALWRETAPAGAPSPRSVARPSSAVLAAVAAPAWAPVIGSAVSESADSSFSPLQGLLAEATRAAIPEASTAHVEAATAEETSAPPAATPEPARAIPPPEPTPVPEPAPVAPQPPPRPAQLSSDEMRLAALAAGWPESEIDELLVVAWCESRFRPDANGWGALGLMQIMPGWFESLGLDVSWAFDPVTNLQVAYHIHENDLRNGYGEWASWTCKP